MAVRTFQAALTPAIVNTITTNEQAFTVGPGDFNTSAVVLVTKPTVQAGLLVGSARCSSATQISITFGNPSGGNITPTAGQVYTFVVID